MHTIKLLSNSFVTLLSLYLVYIPFTYLYSWIGIGYPINSPISVTFGPSLAQHSNPNQGLPNFFTMQAPLTWKLFYFFETLIVFAFYMLMTAYLIRLFKFFSKNIIFDTRCVILIQRVGIILFSTQVLHVVNPAINTYLLSWQLGNTFSHFSFGANDLIVLLVSGFLIVFSWIMRQNQQMCDEQNLVV